MPLYQILCDECLTPHEVHMTLAILEEYDKDDKVIECPNCTKILKKLICPPKTITIN